MTMSKVTVRDQIRGMFKKMLICLNKEKCMKRFAKMHAALLSLAQLGNTTFHQVNALLIMVKW